MCGKKYKILKWYLLIYFFVLMVLCMNVTPHPIGEWDDYSLLTASIINEGNISISNSDVEKAKELFPSLANAYESYGLSGNYIRDGQELAWYFPTYSAVCVPMVFLLKCIGVPAEYAFQLTNLVLLMLMLYIVLKNTKLDSRLKTFLIPLLSINPIIFYLTWMSSEVFIFVFISLAMLFWYTKEYRKSAVMISIAATMNTVILFCGIVMIADYLFGIWRKLDGTRVRNKLKEAVEKKYWLDIIQYGCCYLIGLIPMVYFYYHTGHISLTAGTTAFLSKGDGIGSRFIAYITDWNFGILPYYNFLFVFSLILIFVALYKKNIQYLGKMISFYGIMLLYSIMVHINCGMSGIARYNAWNAVILIWAVCIFVYELGGNVKRKWIISTPSLLTLFSLCAVIVQYGPMEASKTSYFTMTPIAEWVLSNTPQLYNPLGSTFYSRIDNEDVHIDGGYNYITPIYHVNKEGYITKILANRSNIPKIKETLTGKTEELDWLYGKLDKLSEDNEYIDISADRGIQKYIYILGDKIDFSKPANYVVNSLGYNDSIEASENKLLMKFKIEDTCFQWVHSVINLSNDYSDESKITINVNGEEVFHQGNVNENSLEFDYRMPEDGVVQLEVLFPAELSELENKKYKDSPNMIWALQDACFSGFDDECLEIDFAGSDYNADMFVKTGLSVNEEKFSWTEAEELVLSFNVQDYISDRYQDVYAKFNISGVQNHKQAVLVYVNEKNVYEGEIADGDDMTFNFARPEDGHVDLNIILPDAVSPMELKQGEDARKLGLALVDAKFIGR